MRDESRGANVCLLQSQGILSDKFKDIAVSRPVRLQKKIRRLDREMLWDGERFSSTFQPKPYIQMTKKLVCFIPSH